jgi:hypothetical protein
MGQLYSFICVMKILALSPYHWRIKVANDYIPVSIYKLVFIQRT